MWLLRRNVTKNMCCCFYIPISPQLSLRLKRVWDLEWRLVSGLAPGTKLIRCDAVWRSALTVTFPQTWWAILNFINKGILYHLCAVIMHTDITAKGLPKIDISKGLGKDLMKRRPWKLWINFNYPNSNYISPYKFPTNNCPGRRAGCLKAVLTSLSRALFKRPRSPSLSPACEVQFCRWSVFEI